MNEISVSRYNPGYAIDYDKMILAPIPNYFSDLLAKQTELVQRGESQLTQEEIKELSSKCDISQMSAQEHKDFVNYLADKGVIDRPESLEFDPGERISIKGGQAWLEEEGAKPVRGSGVLDVPQFLHPYLEGQYKKLLAEQAVAALRSAKSC